MADPAYLDRMRRISRFVEFLISQGLDSRTIAIYVGVLKRMAAEGFRPDHPTPTELAAYCATTPNTHASRSQLRSTLRWYWESVGYAGPLKTVRVPPQPPMVCRALEDDEARAVEKAALGWWPQGAATLMAMYLALRRTEVAQSEWSRFDEPMNWYTVLGKGSKTATLPVHPVLRDEMCHRRVSGWIFPGRFGGCISPATLNLWIDLVGRAAGVGHLPPHRLRHTSLATANDRLGDLRAVQTFARHSKPETTSGYTRTTARRLKDVSDSLGWQ